MPGAPRISVSPAFAPTGVSFGVPGAVGERVGFGGRAAFFFATGGVPESAAASRNGNTASKARDSPSTEAKRGINFIGGKWGPVESETADVFAAIELRFLRGGISQPRPRRSSLYVEGSAEEHNSSARNGSNLR
jgi:hypothetical protein